MSQARRLGSCTFSCKRWPISWDIPAKSALSRFPRDFISNLPGEAWIRQTGLLGLVLTPFCPCGTRIAPAVVLYLLGQIFRAWRERTGWWQSFRIHEVSGDKARGVFMFSSENKAMPRHTWQLNSYWKDGVDCSWHLWHNPVLLRRKAIFTNKSAPLNWEPR